MDNKIYLRELPAYQEITEAQARKVGANPSYDMSQIPSKKMREELSAYIMFRSKQVAISTLFEDRQNFNLLCKFLQERSRKIGSFHDRERKRWIM